MQGGASRLLTLRIGRRMNRQDLPAAFVPDPDSQHQRVAPPRSTFDQQVDPKAAMKQRGVAVHRYDLVAGVDAQIVPQLLPDATDIAVLVVDQAARMGIFQIAVQELLELAN